MPTLPEFRTTSHKDDLWVDSQGHGSERLVFFHGLGGTHRYWTCGNEPLAFSGHRTVLLDLLGFGNSPRPWGRYSVKRHVEALARALPSDQQFSIIGHSLGAVLAIEFAVCYPKLVKRLWLLGLPHFDDMRVARNWFRRQPGGWIYTNLAATALACLITRRLAGHWLPRLLPDLPRQVAEDLVKHNVFSSTSSLWETIYRNNLARSVNAMPTSIPVHCIHGSCDDTAPLDSLLLLAAARPQWQVTVLRGVDHHAWLRQEATCRELIAEDLRAK